MPRDPAPRGAAPAMPAPVALRPAPRGAAVASRQRATVLAAGAALCALLVFLAAALARSSSDPQALRSGDGRAVAVPPRPAPELGLSGFDGRAFRLVEQHGRLVVVNFWASWCVPCREEAGVLERAWRAFRERGVVFAGVNVWDDEPQARAFLHGAAVSYPNGTDPSGEAAVAYGVRGLPETFVVDRQGRIVGRWIGPLTEPGLIATLRELTAGTAPGLGEGAR